MFTDMKSNGIKFAVRTWRSTGHKARKNLIELTTNTTTTNLRRNTHNATQQKIKTVYKMSLWHICKTLLKLGSVTS